jgi:hypothetical protein
MLVNLESTVAKGVCGYFTTAQHMKLAKNLSQKTYFRATSNYTDFLV